jgi:hypothetical protein
MEKDDYCTCFPDVYLGVKISDCCKKHDDTCSTKIFFNCLYQKFKEQNIKLAWFHASYISFGGAVGCWIKYPIKMIKKI